MGESSPLSAGMLAERERRFAEAEGHYRSIAASDPDYLAGLLRLGILAARDGRKDLSRRYFEQLLALKPNSFEAMEWLANFAREDGLLNEAVVLYRRALDIESKNLRLWYGLSETYLDLWFNQEAIEGFQKLAEVSPDFAPVYERLGVALWREGRIEEAVAALRKAIALAPAFPAPYANLAQLLHRKGRAEEAEKVYEAAGLAAGGSVEKLLEFASQFMRVNDAHQAEIATRKALEISPDSEVPRFLLARILQKQGRFAESEEVLHQLILEKPGYLPPYADFVRSRKMTESDRPILRSMEQWARRQEVQPVDKQQLFYALGKAFDDLSEYGAALSYYLEANGIALQRLPSSMNDRVSARQTADRIIEIFTPETFKALEGTGSPSEAPIFIAGMIRSGTTLTEQIISSHPMVGAAGELRYLVDHAGELLNPDLLSNRNKLVPFAEAYLRRLRFEAGDYPRLTDKMPDNIMVLGLIHVLFPNARMILCRRQPYDNCLSAFVTPHDVPQAFLHSAENLAFLYQEHERLNHHWAAVLPQDRLMVLDYEDLALNPEPTIRRLIEFLGLPWDDACLSHHKNKRIVHTPSLWQVRQGMYSSSVDRWRNYGPWIDELKGYLGKGADQGNGVGSGGRT